MPTYNLFGKREDCLEVRNEKLKANTVHILEKRDKI